MALNKWIDAFRCLNLNALSVAIHKPTSLREYLSHCAKKYDELLECGLSGRSPIQPPESDLSITLPAAHTGGGMNFSEMVILARATKILKPKAIFEIGTFNGLSTAIFILNSESTARIYTLDLPEGSARDNKYILSDASLVENRELGSVPRALGLNQYSQIHCDSMQFDAAPFSNSIDLCLVDGAHDPIHIENDTKKVAEMVTDAGTVFWHDYGGKGDMRGLTDYLNRLGRRAGIYRVPGTSLAWARGQELKRSLARQEMSI